MRRLLVLICFVIAAAWSGPASAQQDPFPPTAGEASSVLSCFFECKGARPLGGVRAWQEVTTLMLINQRSPDINDPSQDFMSADMLFLDGKEDALAAARASLSPEDLDEVNVCRTLTAGEVPVPEAGIVEIVLTFPNGEIFEGGAIGGYGWVKNLLGRFQFNDDEPFDGNVTGIAKTECRVVPSPIVATPAQIRAKFVNSGAPLIQPILVEDTADDDQSR